VDHDSIVGGIAAISLHDVDVETRDNAQLPERADDTGLPRAVADALELRIEAAFISAAVNGELAPWTGSFDELEAELRLDGARVPQKEGRGICMSAFTVGEGRTPATAGRVGRFRQEHLITVTELLGLDFDSRSEDPFVVAAPFQGFDALIYSSHSHGRIDYCREQAPKELHKKKLPVTEAEVERLAHAPRFRVLLRLSRSVTPAEYRALWRWADAYLGGGSDKSCKDPTRLYYTPRMKADDAVHDPFLVRWRGDALNPDSLPDGKTVGQLVTTYNADSRGRRRSTAARAPAPTLTEAETATPATLLADASAALADLDSESRERLVRYARADVNSYIDKLRGRPQGGRRAFLYSIGCRIGEYAALVDVDSCVEHTLDTARQVHVPEPEDHERQIRNGVHEGQKDHVSIDVLLVKTAKKSEKLRAIRREELLVLLDVEGLMYDEYLEASVLGAEVAPPWNPARPGPRKLDDQDALDVTIWVEKTKNLNVEESLAGRMLWRAAKNRPVDSLRDYLRGVQWDGIQRLDTWLSVYVGSDDTAYTRLVGRKWLIGAVARALQPGCKNDQVLVLEGAQALQKSTVLRVLGGNGRFFTDQLPENLADKDASLAMNGTWIVELAEMTSHSRTKVATMKAFITRQADTFRPPYGKNVVVTQRRSVLAGTLNPRGGGWLTDDTGNRRWWPVKCGVNGEREGDAVISARLATLRADVDMMWAEAVRAYDAGEKWWLESREEVQLAQDVQEDRMADNAVVDALQRIVEASWGSAEGISAFPSDQRPTSRLMQVTMKGALRRLECMANMSDVQRHTATVAQALVRFGFERRQVRCPWMNGARVWLYVRAGVVPMVVQHAVDGVACMNQAEHEAAQMRRMQEASAQLVRGEATTHTHTTAGDPRG
jgi:predicted P-loop ATPase